MVIHWATVMIGPLPGPVEEFSQGPVVFKNGPKDLLASKEALDSVQPLGDANRGIVSLAMYAAVSKSGKARRVYPPSGGSSRFQSDCLSAY
jgi:hypothetical protein